jgi:hypothetical protein
VLISLYELIEGNRPGRKVTLEDVAVTAWNKYKNDFCMRGYPEYPNMRDLERLLSALRSEKYVKGNVHNYGITSDGLKLVNELLSEGTNSPIPIEDSGGIRRDIQQEINRILKLKVFNYYVHTDKNKIELLESDFFEFIGTSPRSFNSLKERRLLFLPKYVFLVNEVIPFCKLNSKKDKNIAMILELWNILFKQFGKLIKGD